MNKGRTDYEMLCLMRCMPEFKYTSDGHFSEIISETKNVQHVFDDCLSRLSKGLSSIGRLLILDSK